MTQTPPWAVMEKYDPELHQSDDAPTDWTPSTMTQAVIGVSIMLTIALAFVGAAQILQGAINGLH